MKIARKDFNVMVMGCCVTLVLAGCTTVKQSNPARTATEEMLISTAADRAAMKIAPAIPKGSKVFIDAGNFEGTDSKYAVSAIRSSLLQQGAALVDDKKAAQTIVEIRAGALSTDQKSLLVGIPSFTMPIPLASAGLTTPELALYKTDTQKGVAKFAATVYDARSQQLAAPQDDPQYGFAHDTKHTVLFFINWETNDAVPDDDNLLAQAKDQASSGDGPQQATGSP